MKKHGFRWAALVLALMIPVCVAAQGGTKGSSVPGALDAAVREIHPAPFAKMSEEAWNGRVEQLERDWPELTKSGEADFALRELTAALGDEHTRVVYAGAQDAQLPFYVMKIGGSFLLVQAQQTCGALTGWALCEIGGIPVEEIVARMTPYLSAETDGWRDVLAAQELVSMRMLRQVGAIQDEGPVSITVRDPRTGETQTAEVELLDAYDAATSMLMPMAMTFAQSGYYYATLLEGGELFIQYNVCADNPQMPMTEFAKTLEQQLSGSVPGKILVDLRHNGGGNSEIINPLLDVLARLQQEGSKLYALVGPETFSSGVMDALKLREQGAVLVGEATGGVIGFGELKEADLGEGFVLYCSSKDFSGGQPHEPIKPDWEITQAVEDMFAGVDTVVQAISQL